MANFFRSLGSHSVLVKTTWTEELHLALIRLTDSQWGLIVIHSQPHQDVMDHRDGGLWRKTLDGPWKMLDRPQGRTLPSTVAPATCAAEVPVASTSTSATTSTATAVCESDKSAKSEQRDKAQAYSLGHHHHHRRRSSTSLRAQEEQPA